MITFARSPVSSFATMNPPGEGGVYGTPSALMGCRRISQGCNVTSQRQTNAKKPETSKVSGFLWYVVKET